MPLPIKKVAVPRKNYQRQIRSYLVLIFLLLAGAGYFGFFQYQELVVAQNAFAAGQTNLAEMKKFEKDISGQYSSLNSAFYEDFRGIRNAVEGVLPAEENYTRITQNLDSFVIDLNKKSPSIFMGNLKFNQPHLDNDNGYGVLPFTISLSTTRANFEKMLKYAESSGALDDASRLLDVRSISINFPGQGAASAEPSVGAAEGLLSVSLSINAYFQLPTIL
ncbi:hypothetical protein KJ951_03010 [Patescibacteria group bacterium]|nr:hypothetical protein [Patescibacteria group bacterium]MBU1703350.1 hypothetical protein [Patescibacteria group bacterium]MBU1954173.1 hypothetical protein [Patescibacteria group bacterium]